MCLKLATFLHAHVRLKMSVRALMTTGPSCFMSLYEMISESTEELGFVCSIACSVMLGMKGGGGHFGGAACVGLYFLANRVVW